MKQSIKELIGRIPILGNLASEVYRTLATGGREQHKFPGSKAYWEQRYSEGGDSGAGSYQLFAEFKAQVLNEFIAEKRISSVIELGCGDGNQLKLAKYPNYLGFDVSPTAVAKCKDIFELDETKSFHLVSEFNGQRAELALSLDVIYHLVEDDVFESYMQTLFAAADRYVIIYSSDSNDNRGYEGTHVRHRKLTKWVGQRALEWSLTKRIPNKFPLSGRLQNGLICGFFCVRANAGTLKPHRAAPGARGGERRAREAAGRVAAQHRSVAGLMRTFFAKSDWAHAATPMLTSVQTTQ